MGRGRKAVAAGRWGLRPRTAVLAGLMAGALIPGISQQGPLPVAAPAVAGGTLRGVIKSGVVPLPGVTVTATNTLSGKKFATTSDVTGAWSMTIPQNGRYVLRTEFAAFAAVTHEVLLNAASHEQVVDFELQLASRVAQQDAQETQQGQAQQISQAMRQLGVNGAQSLSLLGSLASGTDAAEGGASASGAALPGSAGNTAFSGDSVAVNGQSGTVSPLAGVDMDRIRDAMETARAQGAIPGGGPGGGFFEGAGPGGGFGGGFGGGGGGFGGGRGAFRGFRPDQPHGAVFWTGNNSELNAQPFALRGQQQNQPVYGSNRFGLTFIGEPYLPKLTKPSGKDTLFLTLSGQRTSSPFNAYANIPVLTDDQKQTCLDNPGNPACRLLALYPAPNLSQITQTYNYFLASTAQSNTTQAGVRYMRSLGANSGLPGRGGSGGGGGRRRQSATQGLRQSINANYNWSHSASDDLNVFPQLAGKQAADNYSVQAGYSLGYHRLNNNLLLGWNRTRSETTNLFTNKSDIATQLGILGPDRNPLNASALNWGVPNLVLNGLTGLNEQQPNFQLQQTISLTDTLSWGHGKHNFRFGGDYRRVHLDILGSSNATGTLYFTGVLTGNPIDDLLAGLPQSTRIQSTNQKSYLRQNVWDLYAQDDFRALPSLTLNYGLRYEYFSPYSEKYDHLAGLAGADDFMQLVVAKPGCNTGLCADYSNALAHPFRVALAPRVGVALRLPKSMVVRAGYGINYTNGQYASFATTFARQPPFANVQTNVATPADPLQLANSFPVPETEQAPLYALDPHYKLPYVQVWNLDIQKTLPLGILLNAGYNGSKGTHLDITSAPRPSGQTQLFGAPVLFNYEQAVAFSNFNAATVRLRKRLQSGVSVGANYTYSHSIDNAGALGGTSTVVAQDWRNLLAEEGNSSIDQRHKVSGDYLYELPFGKDKRFFSGGGVASKVLEGWSISGTFTFAAGTPLTPSFTAAATDVAKGTAGTVRPNRNFGVPINDGGGSLRKWFNTEAFSSTPPADGIGDASRNSIAGPGTVSNAMSLSKTMGLGDTRSMEFRATANNVFNTVQYAGVDTRLDSPTVGQVTSAGQMRQFNFTARFRF